MTYSKEIKKLLYGFVLGDSTNDLLFIWERAIAVKTPTVTHFIERIYVLIKFSGKKIFSSYEEFECCNKKHYYILPVYAMSSRKDIFVVYQCGTTIKPAPIRKIYHPRIIVDLCFNSTNNTSVLNSFSTCWNSKVIENLLDY